VRSGCILTEPTHLIKRNNTITITTLIHDYGYEPYRILDGAAFPAT
jgi:hypothetical protein